MKNPRIDQKLIIRDARVTARSGKITRAKVEFEYKRPVTSGVGLYVRANVDRSEKRKINSQITGGIVVPF